MRDPVAGIYGSARGRAALSVEGLTMHYLTRHGTVRAVDGVSFGLEPGASMGLVGESGCGKSSIALSLINLLPDNGRLISGRVMLGDEDLLAMDGGEVRDFRWRRVAMVFQAAMNAMDPVYRVGDQIVEAIQNHGLEVRKDAARERVARLFDVVGLALPVMTRFPHELSGGMRQRAMIAMALSCEPDLIIADEPTTALDVIVQDRILRELKRIQQELGMSMLYITHDIAVVAEVTERTGVMYAGQLVELGDTDQLFRQAMHPYTRALLSSFPSVVGEKRPLETLGGEPPNLIQPPTGCRFHPRCPLATDICRTTAPPRVEFAGGWAACWHPLAGEEPDPELVAEEAARDGG